MSCSHPGPGHHHDHDHDNDHEENLTLKHDLAAAMREGVVLHSKNAEISRASYAAHKHETFHHDELHAHIAIGKQAIYEGRAGGSQASLFLTVIVMLLVPFMPAMVDPVRETLSHVLSADVKERRV